MRFLHTADWHLGRLFHQVHLTEDQEHVLRQVIAIARESAVQAIVVAGDVYDRAVPPPEAVRLLDDVLAELLLGVKVPVIVTAGNHDSPERLAFGARVLAAQRLHIFGQPSRTLAPVVLHDAHGPVSFYAVPYAEPALVRERLSDPEVASHDDAVRALVASVLESHPPQGRGVFVGHVFVQGGTGSDSERPLSVGTAGTVESETLERFCYAALGHLHRPQDVYTGRGRQLRYSGAPLKYSFDEVGQHRSVTIVDIDAAGTFKVEEVALTPLRELRRVEGTMEALLRVDGSSDYVVARLTDPHLVLDPMGRLRKLYPNILAIERAQASPPGELQPARDRRQLDHAQLFEGFFKEMTGGAPTPEEREVFLTVADALGRSEREVRA
jgi:exonuclease SbcD